MNTGEQDRLNQLKIENEQKRIKHLIVKKNHQKQLFEQAADVREKTREFIYNSINSLGSAGKMDEIKKRKQAEEILYKRIEAQRKLEYDVQEKYK